MQHNIHTEMDTDKSDSSSGVEVFGAPLGKFIGAHNPFILPCMQISLCRVNKSKIPSQSVPVLVYLKLSCI